MAALVCNGNGQGPQGKKARRQMTFSWTEHVSQLTEEEFKLRYRFTFEGFYELLGKIRDDLLVHDLWQKLALSNSARRGLRSARSVPGSLHLRQREKDGGAHA